MTTAELRALLDKAIAGCASADLPELTGVLEVAKVRAMVRALSPALPTTDVVDVATLAGELDLAESWLRSQARTGKLPHIRAGKHIRFRRSEVLAALGRTADHRMGTPASAEKRSNGAAPLPDCYHEGEAG
jgi:hypothetical protein